MKQVKRRFIKQAIHETFRYLGEKVYLSAVYSFRCRKPVNEKLVLFADNRNRPMPDNFIPMLDLCRARGYCCEVIDGATFASYRDSKKMFSKLHYYKKLILKLAESKVVFESDLFPLFDLVRLRPETQIVQLWHACGLGKKWGYAVETDRWGASEREKKRYPLYANQSMASVSSSDPVLIEGYSRAFGCRKDKVLPLGVPRTDRYFDRKYCEKTKQGIRAMIPEIGARKIILFAPTFRGDSVTDSYYEFPFDLEKWKERLGQKYVLLVKFHPLTAKASRDSAIQTGFSYDITNTMTAEEAICAADILITDYSSIMFEYMLFERPIISYVPDLEQYEADRGMFLPYQETAPGPCAGTEEQLLELLKTTDQWFDPEKIIDYKRRFMSACDGNSTQRIFNQVFQQ